MRFRQLRNRLTWWYALPVIALVVTIAAGGVSVLLREAGRGIQERLRIAAQDAARRPDQVRAHYGAADDLVVIAFHRGGPILSTQPIPPFDRSASPGGPHRPLPHFNEGFIFAPFDVHPVAVERDGWRVVVLPKAAWLAGIFKWYVFVAALVIAVASFIAWIIARYVSGKAVAPLVEMANALGRLAGGEFTVEPIRTDDRSELGQLVTLFNHAADSVTVSMEERRRSEAMMRQFVADAGHQLRTPLTVILGYVDILGARSTNADPKMLHVFDVMHTEGQRMRRLIDQLLTLARMDREEEPSNERILVSSIVESLRDEFAFRLDPPDLRVRIEADATIDANPDELYEALYNILDNAVKYGGAASIDVVVRRAADTISVTIEDHGPGIPQRERERIFDRFYRGESSEGLEGSGLGMTIAQRGIERAGGTITVESVVPTGTRVIAAFAYVA
ncbi:MAG: HAMP domain-containing sensor histidine kinase [Vulcanimicrobiaceae bacterium]